MAGIRVKRFCMANPLRVLVVEDSVDDTFFIVRELQKGGFHVDFERVETAAAMQDALRAGRWDLIVSDYSMPQFDGESALSLYLQSGSDAPFVMVSGAIGEERAVEMLKRGAHDCIMKDHLARLVPAVKRELELVRQRRTRRQSEEATAYLASIVQSSDDAIIGKDLEGNVLSWNRGAEKLYGYSAVEMIGQPISVLFPPELKEEVSFILNEIKRGGHIEGLQTLRLRKDRKPVEVSVTVSPIRDSAGKIIGASTFARELALGGKPGAPRPEMAGVRGRGEAGP